MLAEELCSAGEWEEAVEVCKKGLVFHPDHLEARILLGRALMEVGDPYESERILSNAAEQFRKNSIVFKLLSELAAIAGKTESAEEYARIYEAFGNTGSVQAPTSQTLDSESVAAPEEAGLQLDDFAGEAIEELDTAASDVQEDVTGGRKIGLEDILDNFARRLEQRLTNIAAPEAIFSENEKEMLKERIIALLGA